MPQHPPLARFVLPVSGLAVTLREPTGREALLLVEHPAEDPRLALMLAERLGDRAADGPAWADLSVTDIDTMIVRLRQALIGDRVIADAACVVPSCGERVDFTFSVNAYLAHHRPKPPRRASRAMPPAGSAGWFERETRTGGPIRFRLPTISDQIAVRDTTDPAAALAIRCIQPAGLPGRSRARAEAAMAALAPPLSDLLQGHCPHCRQPLTVQFSARLYCLQELRDRARFVYDDIEVLAERFHWSERAILALPLTRRTAYAERARAERARQARAAA